ncbi:PfkB family carbohydrate kinase [Pseudarcicella hirudinis]|uniref:PfkB family carbohydrate kinase n=1 Tax=Pseudarcicella hirudinis TaxID=1079859 RepID=UPI0035ED0B90
MEQFYWRRGIYESEGYKVEVKDTIGSGDAFLAALLNARIQKKDPEESLSFACAMGSLVATYQGATPTVSIAEAESLRSRLVVNPDA